MNLYILVEGKRTERKIYPSWLSYLTPSLERLNSASDAISNGNSYFLISGEGYPRLLTTQLKNSIEDIKSNNVFDYLVVVLDVDDMTPEYREQEVTEKFNSICHDHSFNPDNCKLKVIPQNKCIETWGLGNKKIFQENIDAAKESQNNDFKKYMEFFDISLKNPEDMPKPPDESCTTASFHEKYLRNMLKIRKINYSKRIPNGLRDECYLYEIIERLDENKDHLLTFGNFYNFTKIINS